jgi:hypothetical protein
MFLRGSSTFSFGEQGIMMEVHGAGKGTTFADSTEVKGDQERGDDRWMWRWHGVMGRGAWST